MPVRVLIAEDHAGLRAALRALVAAEPDLQVVGDVSTALDVRSLAAQIEPDVVLLDIGLPDLQGFDSVRELRADLPGAQFLLVIDYEEPSLVQAAIAAGAAGCVVSRAAEATFPAAIRAASQGELYIQPTTVKTILADLLSHPAPCEEIVRDLTPGELEVLRLIGCGCTRRQVAEALGVPPRTVAARCESLRAKLGARSRADLLRYASVLHSRTGD